MAGNLAAKAPEAGELGEPIPIDPFAYTFSSWEQWEEWEKKSIPPPDTRPLSTSLKNPPKHPLKFAPRHGPVRLSLPASQNTRDGLSKPINLFGDGLPAPSSIPAEAMQVDGQGGQEEVSIEGAIPPIQLNDDEPLEFDWPSDEIKRACEAMFPREPDSKLPSLKWIAPDQKRQAVRDEHSMHDIQIL